MPRLLLPENLRRRMKTPLGLLLKGPPEKTTKQLRKIAEVEKPPLTICVGDFVSKNVRDAGLNVNVSIVDHKIMRKKSPPRIAVSDTIFRAANPAGTIELAAWAAVREAIDRGNSLLIIQGEEDLLTLPAILLAPERSLVIYGQPKEGMVVVKVDSEKKTEIQKIIDSMARQE